jgi:sec-independent protein translocase protein TatC
VLTLRIPLPQFAHRLPRAVEPTARLQLVDHLGELRGRLVVAFGTLVVAFAAVYTYHTELIQALNAALPAAIPEPITIGIAEPFMTSIKVSLWGAFAVSMPVLAWQAWGFVAPAVGRSSRRTVIAFTTLGTVLFAGGIAFAYTIALPSSVQFLTGFDSNLYNVQVRARDYYLFASAVLVSIGLVFQLPLVLVGLVKLRLVSTAWLRSHRKYCYLGLTALAVMLPGVDPVLTLMELGPLMVLFEATTWTAVLLERRWNRRREAADGADVAGVDPS